MRTIYVVDDAGLQQLLPQLRSSALTELRRLFAFIGQIPRERAMTVIESEPSSFPERFDLSDAVVRLESGSIVDVQSAMRLQISYVAPQLRTHNIILDRNRQHRPVSPERYGRAEQLKGVIRSPSGTRVGYVIMASTVAFSEVVEHYIENRLPDPSSIQRRLDFTDEDGNVDIGKMARYLSSHNALRDLADLQVIEHPDEPGEWTTTYQQRIGIALGRGMAHECRHLLVQAPTHADSGLGAGSPDLTDDRNYGDFSQADKASILQSIRAFEVSQRKAVMTATYPASVRVDASSFPF